MVRRQSVRFPTNLAREHNRFPWNFDMRERLNVVDCGDLVYALGMRVK